MEVVGLGLAGRCLLDLVLLENLLVLVVDAREELYFIPHECQILSSELLHEQAEAVENERRNLVRG